jgi:hypothetical protein
MSVTQPRIVITDAVLMSTARTVARFFLFRPDPAMTAAARYVIAHYAKKRGIILYAACLMSTHLHMVFKDPLGVYPDFLCDVHRALANVVQAHRGWRGEVFSKHPSVVRLLTPEAILDKIAYVQANPVAAGAVRYAKDWPGLCTTMRDLGAESQIVKRTPLYFRQNGRMPDEASLHFELPEVLVEQHGERGALEAIEASMREHERQARGEMERLERSFLGADRCARTSPLKRATAYEVFGERNPTFATKGGGKQAFFRAVEELRAFRESYRCALEAWRRGEREAEFPHGTWAMRVWHGACCGPAG